MKYVHKLASVAVMAINFSSTVFGQGAVDAYPSKPVTAIIPFAPGGASEQEARLYTTKMSELMGHPFILDFKPGNATIIGINYVAKAVPDGYTLLVVTSSFTAFPPLHKNLPFDIVRDFAPVSLMSQRPTVLLVSTSFPARSFAEYIAYAKANPGKINFAHTGTGGGFHLAGAWMHGATNTQVTFVPYKGTGPILPDLIAGRVDVTPAYLSAAVMPLIKAGKVRVLAISSSKRTNLLPGIATIAEQGVPGFNYPAWQGIIAPGATPPSLVNKISVGLATVAKSRDIVSVLEADGAEPVGSTPEQFKQLLADETERWRSIVHDASIQPED